MSRALPFTALTAAALVSLQPAPAAPFTAKLMVTLDRLSDPRVSPDGRYALYDLRKVDYAANKATHSLWIYDNKTHKSYQLAATRNGGSNGRWSPDGKAIYYLANGKGEITQVFRTTPAGSGAVQVTHSKLDVGSFRLTPDGKTMVLSLPVYPDCPDVACTIARNKTKKTAKTTGIVYDRLFIRHWDVWADGTRNQLFTLALNGGEKYVPLMQGFDGDAPNKPFGGDDDYTISPDGKTVVFSAKWAGRSESWTTNFDLWSVPIAGGAKPQNLTAANKAWDAGPVFSPDGKWLAYRAMKRPGFEADRFAVMLREVATGKTREIAANWDRSADTLIWSQDGRALYTASDDVGQHRIFRIDIASGKVSAVTGNGHIGGFDVGTKGIVFAQDNLTSPADLYATTLGGGAPVRLTAVNAAPLKDVHFGAPEQFSFRGWNNEKVHGYLVKPADFQPGKKYPVAFLIHGGPQGSMANDFHYRWNPQIYAAAGYAAVMIDFHGSTGYGQKFTDAISQHWGDRPLEDLQKGWNYALQKYSFLDGGRACALGASYGGFMVAWIAGNWNQPWRCLVQHDGELDARAMGFATEELWFDEWEKGGTLADNPQGYERFNPVDHIKNWKKPMLVIHGGKDYRIPLEQGIGTFTMLQRRGIPSKFLYFPDENHWVLKPQNSVQWHDEVLGWLAKWTK